MKNPSFVLQAVKSVSFENRAKPQLRDQHEVLLHIAQTGICGSDVHYWQRGRIGDFVLTSPIVLGHESSGTVLETGSAIKSLKPGDRVAIEPGVPCRRCTFCRDGAYNLCPDTIFAATPPWDGTLSKYYTIAADFCYKIPDTMSLEEAALCEPVAVAVQILKVAGAVQGKSVAVFGCGPIGVLCQAVAKAYGAANVLGVDVVPSRLDFAKSFAADHVYLPSKPNSDDPMVYSEHTAETMKKQFEAFADGADIVLECSGAESCIQMGVFLARKGGTYVQAGMGRENVLFPITTACIRALVIKGSIRYTAGVYPTAIDLVARGKVDVKKLVTNRFVFEDAEKAFELVKENRPEVFKVLIQGVRS